MTVIKTLEELEARYGEVVPAAVTKEIDHLTPLHMEYVAASPFVVIASSGRVGSTARLEVTRPGSCAWPTSGR